MAQLMPLPLTVYCFIKIQIGSTFLVPAHPGSPGKGPLNGCVCVCLLWPIGLEISTDVAYGQIKMVVWQVYQSFTGISLKKEILGMW